MYPKLWSDEVEARVRREAKNLDPQKPPEEVVMCKRCVMTNQRPRIVFDKEGVCSACRHAERKGRPQVRSESSSSALMIDWPQRRKELVALLDAHRGSGAYDCVVPCSGGKDSSFVAWTLKHEYGMNPLCATWAPHIYTDIGWRNLQSFIHSGFDVVMAQPNGLLHRKLSRLGLEFYGDPFLPFIYGQLAWPMHVAKQNGVKLVFFGENGEAEYGGDPSANNQSCWNDEDWDRIYMKGGPVNRLLDIGYGLNAITGPEPQYASPFYRLPPRNKTEFHWLGYYLPWHPQGNYYHACEHTGFEANEERSEGTYSKYASLDDKLDGLHYYFGYLKFGIGRCTSDAAHEVRDGELTRDEALALVRKYDGERPVRHLAECLDYLGMDEEHLRVVEDRFRARIPADCAA